MDIKDLITKFGVQVYFVPIKILKQKNAVAFKNQNGYSILVRDCLAQDKLSEVIEHELWHIILGHLDQRSYLTNKQKELEVKINMKT